MGGSDFGVCENFAYRVRDFFFVRGGGTRKNNFRVPATRKTNIAYPSNWGGSIFNCFQKLGLRDSSYPVRLFRNVEYAIVFWSMYLSIKMHAFRLCFDEISKLILVHDIASKFDQ